MINLFIDVVSWTVLCSFIPIRKGKFRTCIQIHLKVRSQFHPHLPSSALIKPGISETLAIHRLLYSENSHDVRVCQKP